MTRLTSNLICEVTSSLTERDATLRTEIGKDLQMLAFKAAGICSLPTENRPLVAVVPMTCGGGVIDGFSTSVMEIASHIGFRSFVTAGTDVSGFAEALKSGADLILMADDDEFIAVNMSNNRLTTNTHCTALGYVEVLKEAEGSLWGKDVTVIGAGRLGAEAVALLCSQGAHVHIHDVDPERSNELSAEFQDVIVHDDIETAVRSSRLILNASPATLHEAWFQDGSFVSWPGVPFRMIPGPDPPRLTYIHDPIEIGVAVMIAKAYSLGEERDEDALPAHADPMLVIY